MKIHGFSNAAERGEKKQLAQELNQIFKERKLTHKNIKNILHITTQQITCLKQMDLGKFDIETLEDLLERLKGDI